MKTKQLCWKDYRWNEAMELFHQLIKPINSVYEIDYLMHKVQIVSDRLANSTWPGHWK